MRHTFYIIYIFRFQTLLIFDMIELGILFILFIAQKFLCW